MSKKDDEIARLKAELEEAKARATDAEAKAARLEKERDAERKQRESIQAFVCLFPEIGNLSGKCLEVLEHMGKDHPAGVYAIWKKTLCEIRDCFLALAQDRTIKRCLKKGSEKIGRRKKGKKSTLEEQLIRAKDAVTKATKAVEKSTSDLRKATDLMNKVAAAKGAENPSNPLDKAAAAIAGTPEPETQEFPTIPPEGRKVPEEKVEAQKNSAECEPSNKACPCCGRITGLITGRVHAEPFRALANRFSEMATFLATATQHCYCPSCDEAFYTTTSDDVPSKPGRQMGQWPLIKAAKLYCLGIPLDKLQSLIFAPSSRLGNGTLGDNLHEWALDTGKPLLDSLVPVLGSQHALLMDETWFVVLQSRGQGICETPAEDDQRKKDYIVVQCSTFIERHRCYRFLYVGSRATESIHSALDGMHPKVLVSDGYSPYASYCDQGEDRPVAQNCNAHFRREIIDALEIPKLNKHLFETDPENALKKAQELCNNGSVAYYLCMVLEAYSKIYGNEASLIREDDETDEAFLQRVQKSRNEYARPLMDHIDTIMCELAKTLTRQTRTGKYESLDKTRQAGAAVVYYMNRRENFRVFLDDPRVPPDSNAVEQAIRPTTVLRKACDFKQSRERMSSLCILMSLFETAKANGITANDFEQWLHDYSRAYYIYRANKTLTRKVRASASIAAALDPKLMSFDPDAGEGFDFASYHPWNYKKRQK